MKRTHFLQTSLVAGGALVVGFEAASADESAFAPNAWIEMRRDGTVLITVHVTELGQGVATSLPMLAADELDVDWQSVSVRTATSNAKKYGNQGIGGSRSLRTSTRRYREAGATARAMIVAAAAAQWNVPASECRTARGVVHHDASQRSIAYAALLRAAAAQTVAKPALKARAAFTIIGKPVTLLEAQDKSTGRAVYGIDIKRRGMLNASIERAPREGAQILGYDAAAARAVHGVRHVIALEKIPFADAFPFWPGVAVLADTYWAAYQGRRALRVHWSEGPYAHVSTRELRAAHLAALSGPAPVALSRGTVDATFTSAARVLEAVYETPLQAHCTMEPQNATADVRSYKCEVWAPTQSPDDIQSAGAQIAGIPLDAVTVHQVLAGGGFGRRSDSDYAIEAIRLSQLTKRPVKVIWTREDDIRHDTLRPSHMSALRAALDGEGRLIAMTHRHAGPSIGIQRAYAKPDVADEEALEGLVDQEHYALPVYRVEFKHVTGVPVKFGWWRAVSVGQNQFALESFIDEIAHATGKDPYDYRRVLLANDPPALALLDRVAERAGWRKAATPGVGRGIAFGAYGKTLVAQVAEVRIVNGRIAVGRVTCGIDCGMIVNPRTVEAQVQGSIAWGIGATLLHEITIANGLIEQSNFDTYAMVRMRDMPEVDVVLVESDRDPSGVGEPPVVPVAPAIANAVFQLTGKRLRTLPLRLA